jgi:hypothetical protein
MTIDINRRLLIYYGYMNILNTVAKLNEQLPICIMNGVSEFNERSFDVFIVIFSIC